MSLQNAYNMVVKQIGAINQHEFILFLNPKIFFLGAADYLEKQEYKRGGFSQ